MATVEEYKRVGDLHARIGEHIGVLLLEAAAEVERLTASEAQAWEQAGGDRADLNVALLEVERLEAERDGLKIMLARLQEQHEDCARQVVELRQGFALLAQARLGGAGE